MYLVLQVTDFLKIFCHIVPRDNLLENINYNKAAQLA